MSVPISYYLNSPELRPDVSLSSPTKSTSRTTKGIDVSLLPLIPTHDDITDLKTYLHGDKESKLQSRLRRREMRRQLRAQTNDETLRQPGYPVIVRKLHTTSAQDLSISHVMRALFMLDSRKASVCLLSCVPSQPVLSR